MSKICEIGTTNPSQAATVPTTSSAVPNTHNKAYSIQITSTKQNGEDFVRCWKLMLNGEHFSQLLKLLDSHSGFSSSSNTSLVQAGKTSLALCPKKHSNPWILDSGASDHMTSLSHFFKNYTPVSGSNKVKVADGSLSSIIGKGSINLSKDLNLKNVLHVPKLSSNLLSVHKLCKDSNCHADFYSSHCSIQELGSERRIGSAKQINGLYYLDVPNSKNGMAHGLSGVTSPGVDSIMLWHYRLGHPSFPYLQKLFPSLFSGLKMSTFVCEQCILAKSHRTVYPSKPYQTSRPFYLIHSDIWGPSRATTTSNKRWFVTFIDDHTRLCWVYLMTEKSEVEGIFKNFYNMIETQFDTKISILHSDNGPEYFKQTLGHFLHEKGIFHQTSCVYTPQQNGIAERKNRHLLEVARALMFSMNVPSYLWGDAVLTACYLINRMPTRVLNFQTPLGSFKTIFPTTRLTSDLPLKVFGCTVYAHISSPQSKLAPRAERCIFIGYASSQKGYKCFNPSTKKFLISMNVTFLESQQYFPKTPLQGETLDTAEEHFWLTSSTVLPRMVTDVSNDINSMDKPQLQSVSSPKEIVESMTGGDTQLKPRELKTYSRRKGQQRQTVVSSPVHSSSQNSEPDEHPGTVTPLTINPSIVPFVSNPVPKPPSDDLDLPIALRKGKRNTYPISNYLSYDRISESHRAYLTRMSDMLVPKNIHEALGDLNWRKAVREEIKALEKNETWEIVNTPRNHKIVGCKWVFTIKQNADGSIERYKARLVAKGFTQTLGIDYEETFAPVAKMNSIRVLFSLAAYFDWPLHQLDVKNAFLNGILEEEVFMKLPPGFETGRNQVCKLKKALYGLKQSPRAWFSRFGKVIKSFGYIQSQADHTLFHKRSLTGKISILIVLLMIL